MDEFNTEEFLNDLDSRLEKRGITFNPREEPLSLTTFREVEKLLPILIKSYYPPNTWVADRDFNIIVSYYSSTAPIGAVRDKVVGDMYDLSQNRIRAIRSIVFGLIINYAMVNIINAIKETGRTNFPMYEYLKSKSLI